MKKLLVVLALFLISATGSSALELAVGKGQIISLPRPAAHVFIADPDVADIDVRSPNYIYVYGLKAGETSLHALDSANNQIIDVNVVVRRNNTNLDKIIKEVLPSSNIHFSTVDSGLIMLGDVDTPEDAQKATSIVAATLDPSTKLVNMLKVHGSDQVMLRVRIAEVQHNELKDFGINLADILTKGTSGVSLFTGRVFTDPTTGAFTLNNGDNGVAISGTHGKYNLTGFIDALETQGLVKVLAEPNLTARSGETASFLAGGEFPIPVPQQNGVTTIDYKQYGVQLNFTPTVLADDKISLKVAPQVSTLAPSAVTIQNNNIPTLSTRSVSTTVELGSGESFAIAGLMRNDVTNDVNKFPWLGDIPVLGALFSSNNFQNNETELVIIITPYIVHGVKQADKLLTPTDGFENPNDFQRILLGESQVVKDPGRAATGKNEGEIAKYNLHGDAGYMLEEQQ